MTYNLIPAHQLFCVTYRHRSFRQAAVQYTRSGGCGRVPAPGLLARRQQSRVGSRHGGDGHVPHWCQQARQVQAQASVGCRPLGLRVGVHCPARNTQPGRVLQTQATQGLGWTLHLRSAGAHNAEWTWLQCHLERIVTASLRSLPKLTRQQHACTYPASTLFTLLFGCTSTLLDPAAHCRPKPLSACHGYLPAHIDAAPIGTASARAPHVAHQSTQQRIFRHAWLTHKRRLL